MKRLTSSCTSFSSIYATANVPQGTEMKLDCDVYDDRVVVPSVRIWFVTTVMRNKI